MKLAIEYTRDMPAVAESGVEHTQFSSKKYVWCLELKRTVERVVTAFLSQEKDQYVDVQDDEDCMTCVLAGVISEDDVYTVDNFMKILENALVKFEVKF